MRQPVTPEYFSLADSSAYLGISERSIETLISQGAIVAYRPKISGRANRKTLLTKSALDAWLQKFKVKASNPEIAEGPRALAKEIAV